MTLTQRQRDLFTRIEFSVKHTGTGEALLDANVPGSSEDLAILVQEGYVRIHATQRYINGEVAFWAVGLEPKGERRARIQKMNRCQLAH